MLRESCGLELSEMVLTKQKNTEENEEVMISGSSKDASSSDVLMESVRMESRQCSKSATTWYKGGLKVLNNRKIILLVTSFCFLQVSFFRSEGKCSHL